MYLTYNFIANENSPHLDNTDKSDITLKEYIGNDNIEDSPNRINDINFNINNDYKEEYVNTTNYANQEHKNGFQNNNNFNYCYNNEPIPAVDYGSLNNNADNNYNQKNEENNEDNNIFYRHNTNNSRRSKFI